MMLYPARAVGTWICDRNIKRLLEAIASFLFWDQSLVSSGRWEIKGHFEFVLGSLSIEPWD